MELLPNHQWSADQVSPDSTASRQLKKIYSLIKRDIHHFQEKDYQEWIDDVENTSLSEKEQEKSHTQQLIDHAYQILESKGGWNVEDERLYEALEKIIFIKGRQGKTKDYFDSIEEVVMAVMNNDLEIEAPTVETSGDQRNILNYFSTTLNYIIEYVKNELVTKASLNSILEVLNADNIKLFVTNISGTIRYSNFEDFNSLNASIKDVFQDYRSIEEELDSKDELNNFPVTLKRGAESGYLSLIEVKGEDQDEYVPEFIYVFQFEELVREQGDIHKISHDLIAPMSSIQGLLGVINNTRNEVSNYLSLLETSTEKLLTETKGQLEFKAQEPELINPGVIVNETISQLQFMAGAGAVKINVESDKIDSFYSFRPAIQSIVQNLLSNAIKYCKPNSSSSRIDVAIRATPVGLKLSISDNGIGVAQDLMPDLFKKGSGLKIGNSHGFGLYFVHLQVQKVEGQISVESKLGEGTCFTIDLPSLAMH